jgi:cytoskeleton-associated protein 2
LSFQSIRPKKGITNNAVLPVKSTRPVTIKIQPRSANITGSQKPKLEPPKLLNKRLTSTCASANPNYKLSSKSHQQHEAGSSTARELSKKPIRSPITQEWKTAKQQGTDQGNAKCTDFVDNTHVENSSLDGFLNELNKENLPQTLSKGLQKTDSELCNISKPKTDSYNQTKSSLGPKQVLGKSSVNSAVLKDRVNKQLIGETQIRTLPVKSQQLSRVACLARPREKPPRTVPPHFIQTLTRTQACNKSVAKDLIIYRNKCGRPNETKLQSYPATEQKVEHTKPRTYPNLIQRDHNNRHPNIKQDQKTLHPYPRPQKSCVLQKSKDTDQKPNLTTGSFNSVILSTPSTKANRTNGNKFNNILQQNTQTLESKLKKALPQNHFLNKTAPRTQAGITTINGRGVPNGAQTNPNIKKNTTAEDQRYIV